MPSQRDNAPVAAAAVAVAPAVTLNDDDEWRQQQVSQSFSQPAQSVMISHEQRAASLLRDATQTSSTDVQLIALTVVSRDTH